MFHIYKPYRIKATWIYRDMSKEHLDIDATIFLTSTKLTEEYDDNGLYKVKGNVLDLKSITKLFNELDDKYQDLLFVHEIATKMRQISYKYNLRKAIQFNDDRTATIEDVAANLVVDVNALLMTYAYMDYEMEFMSSLMVNEDNIYYTHMKDLVVCSKAVLRCSKANTICNCNEALYKRASLRAIELLNV